MSQYAQNTSVSVDKSRAEIEKTLQRYGADKFVYGWDRSGAMIQFRMAGRVIEFILPLPDPNDPEFHKTPAGRRRRTSEQAHSAWEQSCRQRWRALALVIKAKLEAVESGITSFEEEFLAHIMLPNGTTVGRFILPQVAVAYDTGKMPPMLEWKKP